MARLTHLKCREFGVWTPYLAYQRPCNYQLSCIYKWTNFLLGEVFPTCYNSKWKPCISGKCRSTSTHQWLWEMIGKHKWWHLTPYSHTIGMHFAFFSSSYLLVQLHFPCIYMDELRLWNLIRFSLRFNHHIYTLIRILQETETDISIDTY